jgi:hypothetical protein
VCRDPPCSAAAANLATSALHRDVLGALGQREHVDRELARRAERSFEEREVPFGELVHGRRRLDEQATRLVDEELAAFVLELLAGDREQALDDGVRAVQRIAVELAPRLVVREVGEQCLVRVELRAPGQRRRQVVRLGEHRGVGVRGRTVAGRREE